MVKNFEEFRALIMGELGERLADKALRSFRPTEDMDRESYLTSLALSVASTLSLYMLEEYHKWLQQDDSHQE